MNHWQIRLFGKFELRNPEGDLVALPHRKAEGLLAMLVVNHQDGVFRDHAAEALWPDRSIDAQRVNLRQTLAMLRKMLGANAVDSTRLHCSLSTSFQYQSDYENPTLRQGSAFMPGNVGRWFDSVRMEGGYDEEETPTKPAAIASFIETLDWFSANDPTVMYSVMRSASMTSNGIPSSDLKRLIERAGPSKVLPGWRTLWAAYAAESEGSAALSPEGFRTAMRLGEERSDYILAFEAAFNLCATMVVQNKLQAARSIADRALSYAQKGGMEHMLSRALSLKGIVHLVGGDHAYGLELMKKGEHQEGEHYGRAAMQSMRGFAEASFGFFDQAMVTLELPKVVAAETGHGMVDLIVSMAEATIGAVIGDPHDYIAPMERSLKLGEVMQNSYFRTYAHEAAAKIYLRLGEKEKAKREFDIAQRIRRHGGMVYTPWDRMRLQRKTS